MALGSKRMFGALAACFVIPGLSETSADLPGFGPLARTLSVVDDILSVVDDSHEKLRWQGPAHDKPRSRQMRQDVPRQPSLNEGPALTRSSNFVASWFSRRGIGRRISVTVCLSAILTAAAVALGIPDYRSHSSHTSALRSLPPA